MAITFDDAYVGVARLAAPLLRTLDLPATIFVTVGASERAGTYWWDAIEHARRHDAARWAAIARAVGMSAAEPDVTSIGAMRDRILVRRAGRFVAEGTEPPPMLRASSFEELRTLAEDARFEFGCHTLTHPALPLLPPAEQECEIHVAHLRLQKELPRVMPVVAYPFGLYDDATIRAAQRAGLAAGVTMQPRALDARDTVFALPRIGVSEDWTESAIALRANAALRSLFIARMGGRHPRLPADPRQAVV
jgi:peptidoglycan/xylan/chitin deacetylase (PgdA/CDA1 family)